MAANNVHIPIDGERRVSLLNSIKRDDITKETEIPRRNAQRSCRCPTAEIPPFLNDRYTNPYCTRCVTDNKRLDSDATSTFRFCDPLN